MHSKIPRPRQSLNVAAETAARLRGALASRGFVSAAGTANAWPDAASVDLRLFALWQSLRDADAAGRAADVAYRQASARLPQWARSGPEFIDRDGTLSGAIVPWPAIKLTAAQRVCIRPGAFWCIRPGPQTIEQNFQINLHSIGEREAERVRARDLAEFDQRWRRQCREEKKVGLLALGRACDAAWDRTLDIEGDIQKLAPATPHVLVALALIEIAHECEDGETIGVPADGTLVAVVRLLRALRPLLGPGPIADELAELLDNPQKPIADMALWPHSKLASVPAPAQSVRAV